MPNPSTTQVVEFREQIALADDAGGVNRDRMWALELFGRRSGNIRGQRSQLDANQIRFAGEPANNRCLEC
jgi:hypothetical protein